MVPLRTFVSVLRSEICLLLLQYGKTSQNHFAVCDACECESGLKEGAQRVPSRVFNLNMAPPGSACRNSPACSACTAAASILPALRRVIEKEMHRGSSQGVEMRLAVLARASCHVLASTEVARRPEQRAPQVGLSQVFLVSALCAGCGRRRRRKCRSCCIGARHPQATSTRMAELKTTLCFASLLKETVAWK